MNDKVGIIFEIDSIRRIRLSMINYNVDHVYVSEKRGKYSYRTTPDTQWLLTVSNKFCF